MTSVHPLAKSFYSWTRSFADEQIARGFDLVEALPNKWAKAVVRALGERTPGEAATYVGLLLRVWQGPASPEGELTRAERSFLRPFESRAQLWKAHLTGANKWPTVKIKVKGFAKELKRILPGFVGPIVEDHGEIWTHHKACNNLVISSEINLAGPEQLVLQQFVRNDDRSIVVPGYTLMSWLGLGDTSFDILDSTEAEKGASIAATTAELYVDAIESLAQDVVSP
jgi:hypothetical protein